MEVMSPDRGALLPVQEGGSSSRSEPMVGAGPMVSEDVEESVPMKKLVAPSDPTVSDREEHVAGGHAVFRTWCRGRMHQHRAGGRETSIPAVAIDYLFFERSRRPTARDSGCSKFNQQV